MTEEKEMIRIRETLINCFKDLDTGTRFALDKLFQREIKKAKEEEKNTILDILKERDKKIANYCRRKLDSKK